jgi:Zn-dependent protease with chaperone function
MLAKRIRKLYGIDPKSWEHPADKAALSTLKQLKGLDELIKLLVSATTERSMELMHLGSSMKVSPNQYPRLNRILEEIVDTFEWPYTPTMFITQSPFFNAHTFGVKKPFIVVNSSIVKTFDDDELKVVIGHEMGHVMSGHSLYKTLIWLVANVSLKLLPMAELLLYPIVAALSEWDRKSELTADRAGLLALQSEKESYDVLMRSAGGEDSSQVNLNEFFLQAQEYDDKKGLLDSFHKILNQVWMTHPYPVVRMQELKSWAASGFYESILSGNYIHRVHRTEDAGADIKDGYDYYRKTIDQGEDPISKLISGIGTGIEKAAGDLGGRLKDMLGKP